jgi:hypothetical protein
VAARRRRYVAVPLYSRRAEKVDRKAHESIVSQGLRTCKSGIRLRQSSDQ